MAGALAVLNACEQIPNDLIYRKTISIRCFLENALDTLTVDYLTGSLKSSAAIESNTWVPGKIINYLPVPVFFNYFYLGVTCAAFNIEAGSVVDPSVSEILPLLPNLPIVLTALDGSLIAVMPALPPPPPNTADIVMEPVVISITPDLVAKPHNIGPIPEPSPSAPIPSANGSVLVGCGLLRSSFVIRSQRYELSDESISVAPGETFTTGFTTTQGMTSSSSTIDTVASSLSMSTSVGWGPISTSISASLSQTSTSMQSQTKTETTTRYYNDSYKNETHESMMILTWRLVDTVTIYNVKTNDVLASISSYVSPTIKRVYSHLILADAGSYPVEPRLNDKLLPLLDAIRANAAPRRRPHG